MGFIEHPGANFPLRQHLSDAAIAQLFRGNEQDAYITQAHPIQYIGPFRHGKQAIDGRTTFNAACLQSLDLVFHQRHQRGNDHGQRAGADKA